MPQMVRIAALHTPPMREAIHALKYENRPELAEPLARYLVAALLTAPRHPFTSALDVVVPVPLHEVRRRERGYNQSELLARAFCKRSGLPHAPNLLSRERPTASQVGLNALERQANVAEAFVAKGDLAGKQILLVDDVYTTGATMRACAVALQTAGAEAVYGLTLACPK